MSFLHLYCAIIVLTFKCVLASEYARQPQIFSQKGDLILEAAHNQDIHLRLSHGSSLLINNIDIMDKIRQRKLDKSLKDTSEILTTTPKHLEVEMNNIRKEIDYLSEKLSSYYNRSEFVLLTEIERNIDRIRRLNVRIGALQKILAKDECAEETNPCKNGGTCYDLYKGYHCECTEGWKGKNCEEDIDECYLWAGTDLGCQNNAICINTPGGYRCTCPKGFSGTHCRLRSTICMKQSSESLCGHGVCVPANNHQGYTCICDQGWTKNATAPTNSSASLICDIDVDECESSRNPCHGECINLPGSFKCGPCPIGYSGNGVTCIDMDECSINNGGCSLQPKVRCINTEGSFHCGRCPLGWTGDGHSCELTQSNSCNREEICHPQAKCEYISNVATCTCPHGMFGHGFGPTGCHSTPISNSCEQHICQNNGTCLLTGRGTSCLCPSGYSGALCETADGCHPNPCENGASCKPLSNKLFKCSCQRGSTGKRCEILRSVCATVQRKTTGELSYPTNGATEYTPDERCAWIIRTLPSQILNLTFTSFDLEEDAECSRDWLQIHDGTSLASQLIGRFCGKNLPLGGSILSSQHQLFFWFRSDNTTNRPGFHMTWKSQPHVCGDDRELDVGDEGILRSPGFPGKMPAHRDCEWMLSAPYGYRFVLRIFDITMGLTANCTGDSFKIYDADFLLKEYCESTSPEPIRTSTNQLKLHFHTDAFGSDSSFQLHYEVESSMLHCGGIFTEATGIIIGPSNSPLCLYLIQQPPNTQIRWEFLNENIFDTDFCFFNIIEIYDGKTVEDGKLLSRCGGKSPAPVISSSNFMLIRYTNLLDETKSKFSFKAKYSRVCEFNYSDPDVNIILSPNYPKAYPNDITCTYHIYGPEEHFIGINITDISLSGENGHQTDTMDDDSRIQTESESQSYLDVHLSYSEKRRFYKASPMELYSELNKMTLVFHCGKNRARARGFRLEYRFIETHCGGVYTRKKGTFRNFGSKSNCKYIFEAPEGNVIELSLNYVARIPQPCLLIYGNSSDGTHYLLKNNTLPNVKINATFNYNLLTVLVDPNQAAVDSNLYLFYGSYEFHNTSHDCGGNFNWLYGSIKSPNWPSPYDANLECVWTITAPLGKKIELTIQNFTLESDWSDILEIRNGKFYNSPLIGRYGGDQIPRRIPSFGNSLYLRFTSDSSVEDKGFHLTWQQTETGCGGKLTSYKGSIHTPHREEETTSSTDPSNIVCDWHINVVPGSSIRLKVTASTDILNLCRNKRLQIYDGGSSSQSLIHLDCSSEAPLYELEVTSTGNQLLIVYIMGDYSKDTPEFAMDYETNCQMTLDHMQGIIESPNFPEPYPEMLNCKWDIKARTNNKIQLAFSHFSLEMSADEDECTFDYVEIVDMKNDDILKKQRLCSTLPDPIVTEGNRMVIHFVTDYIQGKNGFHAEYAHVGCGEILTKEFGSIKSPNYPYSVDMECEWYIEVPAGKQIVFTLVEFHMDVDDRFCTSNALIVKNTKDSKRRLMVQCSTLGTPHTVISSRNHLYIYYKCGSYINPKFFRAVYSTKEASCGGLVRSHYGLISSPNYPQNTIQAQNCTWEVVVPDAMGIRVYFNSLQMAAEGDCNKNFINMTQYGDTGIIDRLQICKSGKKFIVLKGNRTTIDYMTEASLIGGRFSMAFSKNCGGKIETDSGLLVANTGDSCKWTFSVPEGSVINVNILEWDCFCPTNSSCEGHGLGYVKNYADDQPRGNEPIYMCEMPQNHLTFETSSLQLVAGHINFKATFSTVQHSCGGNLKMARGTLVSPYYPASYPSNVDCTWEINVAMGNTLQIDIEELDLPTSDRCNEDYLEIRASSRSKLLGVFCGNQIPEEPVTSFESLWIRFHSSQDSTGKGFKLKWNYAHLNEIVNKTYGSIDSPPVSLLRLEDEPFAWRILIERGQFIALHFNHYREGLKLFDGFDESALEIPIFPSPFRFISSSNVVYFKTNPEKHAYFSIKWNITDSSAIHTNTTTSTCHTEKMLAYNATMTIRSPNYPNGYEPNLSCDWIIQSADPHFHLFAYLMEVNLETSVHCSSDYLQISTSTDMIHWHEMEKLCDIPLGRPFPEIHGTPNLKFNFVSDSAVNKTGFSVSISPRCGSNITQSVGVIDGRKLLFEDECVWHITVKPGKRIMLQFDYETVSTGNIHDCMAYVVVYDGLDSDAPLLRPGKICNPPNVTQIRMNSTSNYVTIKYYFHSVARFRPKLWDITYREFSDCNEEFRLIPEASTINISSPNYPNVPQPHTECEWRVLAPVGELIKVEFVDRFDMNSKFCDREFIELVDGGTSLGRKMGKFCHKPDPTATTQNILYMRYLTDISEPRMGFKAKISIVKCGGSYNSNSGSIMSPGYPHTGAYPSFSQCDYVISLPVERKIRLIIQDMDLPFDANQPKSQDYLEIIPISGMDNVVIPPSYVYGNTTKGTQIDLDVSKTIVRFHTFAKNTQHHGFSIKYNYLSGTCMQDITGDSGHLTMHLPTRTYFSMHCRWRIKVTKGLRIRLEFLNMDDFKSTNGTGRTPLFTIYNDHEMLSTITTFDANNFDPTSTIKSTDNTMLVAVSLPTVSAPMMSIRARYYSNETSFCPPNIGPEDGDGSIDIQDWQPPFSQNYFCRSQIKSNDGETLVFNISTFTTFHPNRTIQIFSPLTFRDNFVVINYRENVTEKLQPLSQASGFWQIIQTNTDRIRKLTMTYKRHSCGGKFTLSNNFHIEQPAITDNNYGPILCVWFVLKPFFSGRRDLEYKLRGNFTFSDSCEREFMVVKESRWTMGDENEKRICKDNYGALDDYTFQNTITYIAYQAANYSNTKTQFSMQAVKTVTCGSETKIIQGTSMVEITKETYENNIECSWIFNTQPGYYPQVHFFGRFFLEDSPNCTKDYLEIQHDEDGLWIPDARYCGRHFPPTHNSSSSRMQVIFRTNENVTADGFSFFVNKSCSAVLNVTSELQRIVTPAAFGWRDQRVQCDYVFQSSDSRALINVRGIRTSAHVFVSLQYDCRFGFTVYRRNSQGEEEEGGKHCEDEFEERSYMYLRLHFDSHASLTYSLEFSFDTCGGNVTTSYTTIWPQKHETLDKYADDMNCIWHVTAPDDHSIAIRFKYFDMEKTYDHVSIYVGSVIQTEKLIKKLSGNLTANPPTVSVDHHQAVINSVSDFSNSGKGFQATIIFLPNCNERIFLTDGNSPVHLARNFKIEAGQEYMCIYHLNAPKGYRIRVDMKKIQINNETKACKRNPLAECSENLCNTMELFDSAIITETSMGKFCSGTNTSYISSYGDASLKFMARQLGQYSFEIVLTMEQSICGALMEKHLEKDERFVLAFPQNITLTNYKPNVHCTWRFEFQMLMQIHFNFADIQNSSQTTGKCLDYIVIKTVKKQYEICGHITNYSIPITMLVPGSLEITFHSDASIEGKGFEAIIEESEKCNRTYTSLNGQIYLVNIKNDRSILCNDTIVVGEQYYLNFYIRFRYLINYNCGRLYFRISDLKTNKTIYVGNCTSMYDYDTVFTTTNAVRIEATNFVMIAFTYTTSNRKLTPGCGGTFQFDQGFIQSPPYTNDRNYSECRWNISVPSPNVITLEFKSFNMGPEINCHLDNVKLFDIMPDGTEKLLKTLCGSTTPGEITSGTNRLAIISKKSPNFDGTYWSVTYAIGKNMADDLLIE
ncbi:cubilin homolog [Haematobia irritans]|uniref:cubilin homolog n=1 Tax=Haematobia irritans TaxID=7368 RepID=UPI003F50C50F